MKDVDHTSYVKVQTEELLELVSNALAARTTFRVAGSEVLLAVFDEEAMAAYETYTRPSWFARTFKRPAPARESYYDYKAKMFGRTPHGTFSSKEAGSIWERFWDSYTFAKTRDAAKNLMAGSAWEDKAEELLRVLVRTEPTEFLVEIKLMDFIVRWAQ